MPAVPPDPDTSSDDTKPSAAEPASETFGTSRPAGARPLTLLQTIYAVAAALFGVRSRAGFKRDMTRGNPAAFILAGFVLFVVGCAILWVLVHFLVVYLVHHQGM